MTQHLVNSHYFKCLKDDPLTMLCSSHGAQGLEDPTHGHEWSSHECTFDEWSSHEWTSHSKFNKESSSITNIPGWEWIIVGWIVSNDLSKATLIIINIW